MSARTIVNFIVIGSLILYIWGMYIIGSASLAAETEPPEINQLWINLVAGVTTVLGLNAGAYLGLPSNRIFPTDLSDPQVVRGWATILYVVVLFIAFIISATASHPHESLTEMGGTILGLIMGVLTVFLGRQS